VQTELISQGHQLRVVLAIFEQAKAQLLPPVRGGEWSGAAQILYGLNLLKVHTDAVGALEHLRLAVERTQRALDSLDSRG